MAAWPSLACVERLLRALTAHYAQGPSDEPPGLPTPCRAIDVLTGAFSPIFDLTAREAVLALWVGELGVARIDFDGHGAELRLHANRTYEGLPMVTMRAHDGRRFVVSVGLSADATRRATWQSSGARAPMLLDEAARALIFGGAPVAALGSGDEPMAALVSDGDADVGGADDGHGEDRDEPPMVVLPAHSALERLVAAWALRAPREPPLSTLAVEAAAVARLRAFVAAHDRAYCRLLVCGTGEQLVHVVVQTGAEELVVPLGTTSSVA